VERCLASEAALHVGDPYPRSSEVGFISDTFVPIRVPIRVHSWSCFAPFAAIPYSRVAGEAVGAPILGADTMMYEEKTGWIVSFFDGF
jgi:hypothetical protein